MLQDKDPIRRMYAVASSASMVAHAAFATTLLLKSTQDERPIVRGLAAWALGILGVSYEEVANALQGLLHDASLDVQMYAAQALEKTNHRFHAEANCSGPDIWPSLRDRLDTAETQGKLDPIPDRLLPVLLEGLQSVDFYARASSLRVLKLLGAQVRCLADLIDDYLSDEHYLVRLCAIQALMAMGITEDHFVAMHNRMIHDDNTVVRTLAMELAKRKSG